jgi:hypothetical protein
MMRSTSTPGGVIMMHRIFILVAAVALLLSLAVGLTAQPALAQGPSTAAVTPASGPAGSTVTGSGANWTPGDHIQAYWADNNSTLGNPVVVASDGTFNDPGLTIPPGAAAGSHQILLSDEESRYFVAASFNVMTLPVPTITSVGTYTKGVLVYFDIHYADPGNDAEGFGFVGVNGSGWAEENHPFSSPSYGIVGPDSIAYPFNEACGTSQQYASYVQAWIYDTAGDRSTPVVIHLVCATWSYQAGGYAGKSGMVHIDTQIKEQNSFAHRNDCGPAASAVLISAWTNNVPSIATLARLEYTNSNSGTLATNMPGPINHYIGTDYYTDGGPATSQTALSNRIGKNILSGHPLITALQTRDGNTFLNGWDYSGDQAPHIVTIYGFDFTSPTQGKIYYMETAGTVSGTDKTGPQEIDYQNFWTLVQASADSNVQIIGAG